MWPMPEKFVVGVVVVVVHAVSGSTSNVGPTTMSISIYTYMCAYIYIYTCV